MKTDAKLEPLLTRVLVGLWYGLSKPQSAETCRGSPPVMVWKFEMALATSYDWFLLSEWVEAILLTHAKDRDDIKRAKADDSKRPLKKKSS